MFRLKKYQDEMIKYDLKFLQLMEDMVQNRHIVRLRACLKRIWSDHLYHKRCIFLFGKSTLKNFIVRCACCGKSYDEWPPTKIPMQRVSEDEAHRKGVWWFVGPVDNPWSYSG